MIVSGDKRASSAFLEGLRAEPVSSATPLNGRSILQVSGLDHAIASADDDLRVRARTRSEAVCESTRYDLGKVGQPPTDDVAAPAIHYVATPPCADASIVIAVPRLSELPSFPAPIVVLDRALFYRPPPPAEVERELGGRARLRRLAWSASLPFIVPVATLIAVMAIFANTWTEEPHVTHPQLGTPLPPAKLVHPADEIMVIDVKLLKTAPPTSPRR